MKRIYFDNAATTPLDKKVAEAMYDVMQNHFGNPSSIYAEGRKARSIIEQARKQVARFLGASIGEIFFTSGGTESNNMALKGAVRDLGVERIISSKTEHHCVLHTLESLARYDKIEVAYLPADKKGHLDLEALRRLLGDQKKKTLVSLMHANNEIGTKIPFEDISKICQEYGVLFHSDTVQSIGYYPIDVNKVKVNFIAGSAHKFYGPKGTGFVYINSDNMIKPFIDGGAQERNMRAGTENIYGIVGLAKALEIAHENRKERQQHISEIKDYFIQELSAHFRDLQFYGGRGNQGHYKIQSVSFPPSDKTDLVLLNLDIAGISVSGGSACSSGADAGSHVIRALNLDPHRKAIRFSFSHHNTKEEVDFVVQKLRECLPEKVLA